MIRFGTYPSLVSLIQRRHSVTINLLCSFLNTCLSMLKNSWSMVPLSARSNLVISSFASSEDLLAQSQSPIVSWDYSNISYGINSYIDSRWHRSAPWKLFLPNLVSIVRAILQTRKLYPNQRVLMWKYNMAGWYCSMLLDPSKVPFFAIMWQNQVLIDPTLLFSNRGAALAAQRFILAIV